MKVSGVILGIFFLTLTATRASIENPIASSSSSAPMGWLENGKPAPDTSTYADFKDAEVWRRLFPFPANVIQLSVVHIEIRIEDDEPLGFYAVEANVKDRINRITLNLKTGFTAKANDEMKESGGDTKKGVER